MRKFAALAVVALMATAGCKSSDDEKSTDTNAPATTETSDTTATSDSTGGTETTEYVSTDNRAPGVSDDTIKIGIEYQFFTDQLKETLHTWHGDYKATYQAVIDAINAEGGIHGRMLEPVYFQIDLGVDGMDDAACTALTEDTEVFVALGYFSGGDQAMCFLDTHETAVVGAGQSDELRAQAKAPWFTTETSGGDSEADGVKALVEAGVLEGKVAVVGTQGDQEYYESVSKALLADGGIDVVDEIFVDTSSTDTTVVQGLLATALERAKGAGAETLLFIGTGVSTTALDELVKTDWRPALRFVSQGSVGMYIGDASRDRSILDGAYTVGGYPSDFTYLHMTDEATTWCVDVLKGAGIELVEFGDWTFESGIGKTWVSASLACGQLQLLRAILEKAGPNLDYGMFQHAGETLGEVYVFGDTNPRTYGPGSAADGDPQLHLFQWDATENVWSMVD